MESRWFVRPGQKLEETNISDRQRALHITSNAWSSIKFHLHKKRLKAEALEKERARKKAIKAESQAMVNSWPDSVMNLFRRKNEERIKNIEANKEERMQRFFEMRKEQDIIRQQYVSEMRQKIYEKTGFPREINNAFRTAEVMYERKKQIEIKKLCEKQVQELEDKFAENVKKNALNEKQENEEKERKRREKNKEFAMLYLKEIQERKEREQNANKAKTEAEIADNINAVQEMHDIENSVKQERQDYKNMIERRLQKHRFIVNERKRFEEQGNIDKDKIISVQIDARDRIKCLREKKTKELRDAFIARNNAITGIVPAIEKEKLEHEKELLNKAEEEKIKEQDERENVKIEYAQKLRNERIAENWRTLQNRKNKDAVKVEVEKLDMLNRYKSADYHKKDDQERVMEKYNNVIKYKKELEKQMNEKRDFLENEAMTNEVVVEEERKRIEAEDKKFFECADRVKEMIKSRGDRTTIPLEKVVKDYMKVNNLPYKANRSCEKISNRFGNKPGKIAYDHETDPNYMKANWKTLYD